jgi:hypothetical protein
VGSVHSANCELFSVDWVTGKPDGQHCCTNCRRVVHCPSFKNRLKTVLKKGAIDGFGKTNHKYLTQEQLRYVVAQSQAKAMVGLRAQSTRSKARRRKDQETRLENILQGDAKRMVDNLRALHRSGRLEDKAAWFELPAALLHSSKLKEVNHGGHKRSTNMRWPKRVKQIVGMLRKMGGKRAVTLLSVAANGPTLSIVEKDCFFLLCARARLELRRPYLVVTCSSLLPSACFSFTSFSLLCSPRPGRHHGPRLYEGCGTDG